MPLSCETGGVLPELPRVCIDGWCVDAPSPIAHANAVLGFGSERWFALPTHLVQMRDGSATAYLLPHQPVSQLVGSADVGVWAIGGNYQSELMHFDGTAVRVMPRLGSGFIQVFVPLAANDLWAMNGGGVFHGDGVTWTEEVLPAEVAGLSLGTMAVASNEHIWVSTETYDYANERFVYYLLHRDHGQWKVIESPVRGYALWAAGPHDLWISTGSSIVHYDGGAFVEQVPIPAETLSGRARNDVWAVASGPDATVAHWDGASWTSCPRPGVRRVMLGEAEAWTLTDEFALSRYDGQWADVPRIGGLEAIHPITGSTEVLAGGGELLLRRDSGGAWNAEPAFPSTVYVSGLHSRAPDDIWAVGGGAAHFDGTTWLDTNGPWSIMSFCTTEGVEAFAMTYGGLEHFDGQAWNHEASFAPGSLVLCPGGDDVWIGHGTEPSIGHRVAGRWVRTAVEPWIGRAFHVAGGPLWSIALDGFSRLDGAEWMQVDLSEVAALVPAGTLSVREVSGTSATDTWFLVDVAAPPISFEQYAVHFDGIHFDRAVQSTGTMKLFALAPDDLLLVGSRFETVRLAAGTATTLSAGRTDVALGYGGGAVYFSSATDGWAVSDEGTLLRFDGTTWSIVPGYGGGFVAGWQAFSPTELWVLANGTSLARYDGQGWTTLPLLLLQPGERGVAMWGASANDVWITTNAARFIRVIDGAPTVVATGLPSAEQPYELGRIHGTSANDVWFSGTNLVQTQYLPTLYHWDGSTLTRYRTLRRAMAMRRQGGELYATAYDAKYGQEVWQRVADRWIVRTDLTPTQVFPGAPRPPYGSNRVVGNGPWYTISGDPFASLAGQVIWRK